MAPTMAFMATSTLAPVRSIPSRMATASALAGVADSTVSCRFTVSSTLGFTSRQTTEATAWFS